MSITIPKQFELRRVIDARGWTETHDAAGVHFTGGPIEPYTCAYFSLTGVANLKQTLTFPLSVTDNQSTVFPYVSKTFGDPYAAQLVYVRPERRERVTAPVAEASQSGVPVLGIALAALILIGLLGGYAARRGKHCVRGSGTSVSSSTDCAHDETSSLRK